MKIKNNVFFYRNILDSTVLIDVFLNYKYKTMLLIMIIIMIIIVISSGGINSSSSVSSGSWNGSRKSTGKFSSALLQTDCANKQSDTLNQHINTQD